MGDANLHIAQLQSRVDVIRSERGALRVVHKLHRLLRCRPQPSNADETKGTNGKLQATVRWSSRAWWANCHRTCCIDLLSLPGGLHLADQADERNPVVAPFGWAGSVGWYARRSSPHHAPATVVLPVYPWV